MIKKGIILAGGTGSRLYPATKVTNKHLLPVYDSPMIFYPLNTLKKAGIEDILIVCGEDHVGDFARLLKDGSEFGVKLTYKVQTEAGGIAQALSLAEDFVNNQNMTVVLGDNIYEDDFSEPVQAFEKGAHVFLKEVPDPNRFGVAELDENNNVLSIEEKPENPKTNFAVTGLYLYDFTVFNKIRSCKPSARGELEITDVSNLYIQEKNLGASIIKGNWSDAGTHESLFRATVIARDLKLKNA